MIKIYDWGKTPASQKKIIMDRAQADMESIKEYVAQWLEKVRVRGDAAVLEYTRQFDNKDFMPENLRVSAADIKKAYEMIAPTTLSQMKEQIRISRAFHEEQARRMEVSWQIETVPGVITGTKTVPIDAVGLYVPAGKAPLPTVAQILTVAAAAAGVPRKVVCFAPTDNHYEIIVAANEAGADEIYRVGGIAAIGALTYGTETIKKVNKIAGPGNPYVQAAKLQVFGAVGIDMLSGPSEALIMADESSDPRYLAADILARCEHGSDSAGVVVTDSRKIAEQTLEEVKKQSQERSRQKFINDALDRYSAIIVVKNEDEMIDFANDYSAEHLEIQTRDPQKTFARIRNAGSVFIGNFAPVAVGDYASGTNHCLPTGVAPKFASPIGVESFVKHMEFQELTAEGLKKLQPIVQAISRVEGLDAHENSVNIRFEYGPSADTRSAFGMTRNMNPQSPQIALPPGIKAILWDMDGVLIDSLGLDLRLCATLLQARLTREDISLSREFIKSIFAYDPETFWNFIFKKISDEEGVEVSQEERKEILDAYNRARQTEPFALNPGIQKTLSDAHNMNLKMAVVSNNATHAIEEILNNVGIASYFSVVVGNDIAGLLKKPAPDTYLYAARKLGVSPSQCVVIEDSDIGIAAGKAAGCLTIKYDLTI